MSRLLRALAVERASRGESTVIVEVLATRGSVPREAGTRMLVWRDGIAGTIGGGNLEWRALERARAMLLDDTLRPDDESIALGASLGQCCGGAVTLRYRIADAASLAAWDSWAAFDAPTIHVFGAGHVGRAVVQILQTLDAPLRWIDERDDGFPPESSGSNVERVCVDSVEAEVSVAMPGSIFLVLTHQHDLDLTIVEAILRRGDFAFLGLIGSTTKRRRFAQLLARRGIDGASIARITCPIGLDGIVGKEPAHIAIAVAAQVLPLIEAASGPAAGERAGAA